MSTKFSLFRRIGSKISFYVCPAFSLLRRHLVELPQPPPSWIAAAASIDDDDEGIPHFT